MDQGGLKRSGNRDDGLTFRPTVELDIGGGGGGGGPLHTAVHLPVPREPLNGNAQGGRVVVDEGSTMKEGKSMGIQTQPLQPLQQQQQQQQHQQQQQQQQQQHQHHIDMFNMEGNLSFLEHSIADLDRMSNSHVISTSSNSILVNLPLPNLFPMQHVKQEVDFCLEKDLVATYIGPLPGDVGLGGGGGSSQLDSGIGVGVGGHLMEDSQIWNDLELCSSMPDISDFELESEVAHLDTVLHEAGGGLGGGVGVGGGGGVLLTEGSPCIAEMCPGVNGAAGQHTHPFPLQPNGGPNQQPPSLQRGRCQPQPQQVASLISSVVVKEEKAEGGEDSSFLHLYTPGVVKQEKLDAGDHCQASCLQSRLGPLHGAAGVVATPTSPTNTTTGSIGISGPAGPSARGGPVFDYRGAADASAAATASSSVAVGLPNQKPFGMYSGQPQVRPGWGRGNGYGELSSVMGRCGDGLPSSAAVLAAFPVGFPR
ncbi:hypothetical protein CRUP_007817 [Coryphaenoides rupestris]|nr:hypothetical protein CRUP_007817 [Coryphaenoides rupestris]